MTHSEIGNTFIVIKQMSTGLMTARPGTRRNLFPFYSLLVFTTQVIDNSTGRRVTDRMCKLAVLLRHFKYFGQTSYSLLNLLISRSIILLYVVRLGIALIERPNQDFVNKFISLIDKTNKHC